MPGPLDWIGNQADNLWGSLFGSSSPGAAGSSVYGPPGSMAPNASATLGGLLDPRGIREQAFYSGLGALSQGLLAAGMRRPAGSPSPLPQALGAFGPAYQGALQSGYQTAAAEQQFRQREAAERTRLEREQAWTTALAAATPAERGLMQQMGPEQWAQMQGQVEAARRRPGTPTLHTDQYGGAYVFDADAWRRGQPQPGQASPAGGQPPTSGGAVPGQAPQPGQASATPAMPSSGNPVIDATLNQIRPSESGNNPAAVSRGPDGQIVLDRNGQPLAGGLYQFTEPTFEGVRARHPELNLTQGGRFNADQAHRAAQAHAADILRDLAPYIGRRGPNGEIISGDMLIRGAWAGGVEGVRRYIDSGGRRNPADVNGTSIGGYFTGQQVRGGGGGGGSTPPPTIDPGIGEGGSTVSMAPGATPLPGGATAVPAGVGAALPEVAAGRNWLGAAAGPQPQAQSPQPQVRPTTAPAPAAPSSIPGVTVLRPGQRPVGELVQVVGPNGRPMFVTREQALAQGLAPYHAPAAGSDAPFGPSETSRAYGLITDPQSDPRSENYQAAWNIVSRGVPQWVPDTRPGAAEGSQVLVNVPPDMRRFRQPGSSGAPAPTADDTAPAVRTPEPIASRPAPHTPEQAQIADYASRMESSQDVIARLEARGYTPSNWDMALMRTGDIGNLAMSTEAQQYHQAAREWILAKLRRESGAAIGSREELNDFRTYFPQPLESPEVIAQKARAREEVQRNQARAAGSAYRSPLTAIPPAEQIGSLPPDAVLALGNSYHRMNDAQRRAFETAVRALPGPGAR